MPLYNPPKQGISTHNDLLSIQGGTANLYYHLTDTQHDTLTDGGDASALHNHFSLYEVPLLFGTGLLRVNNSISTDLPNYVQSGTNITVLNDGNGKITLTAISGGTPGGNTTEVQFNDAGAFAGASDVKWNKTDSKLLVGANATATDFNASMIISKGDVQVANTSNTAMACEAYSAGVNQGVLIFTKNSGANEAVGLKSLMFVDNTNNTGDIKGGQFEALATHDGGDNYALYADAANGNDNYALYAKQGKINVQELIASEIVATDASKNLQTLATSTYPSLTELSYVKGVTSGIQDQLSKKYYTKEVLGSALTQSGADYFIKCPFYMYCGDATTAAFTKVYKDGAELTFTTDWTWGDGVSSGSNAMQLRDNVKIVSRAVGSTYTLVYYELKSNIYPEMAMSRDDSYTAHNRYVPRNYVHDVLNTKQVRRLSGWTFTGDYRFTATYTIMTGGSGTATLDRTCSNMVYCTNFTKSASLGNWRLEVWKSYGVRGVNNSDGQGTSSGIIPFRFLSSNIYDFPYLNTTIQRFDSGAGNSKGIKLFRLRNIVTNETTEFSNKRLAIKCITIKSQILATMNRYIGRYFLPRFI